MTNNIKVTFKISLNDIAKRFTDAAIIKNCFFDEADYKNEINFVKNELLQFIKVKGKIYLNISKFNHYCKFTGIFKNYDLLNIVNYINKSKNYKVKYVEDGKFIIMEKL